MPRSQCRPAFLARSTLGRMPTAITTRSAAISSPSAKRTAGHAGPRPGSPAVCAGILNFSPRAVQRLAQHVAGGLVELALHQRVDEMNDRHLHAALHQAVGGFQAEQAAADDDGAPMAAGRRQHQVDVVDVAKGDDARQFLAGQRQDDRMRAGGDQQPVIGHALAGGGDDLAGAAVDHAIVLARAQLDAVLLDTRTAG